MNDELRPFLFGIAIVLCAELLPATPARAQRADAPPGAAPAVARPATGGVARESAAAAWVPSRTADGQPDLQGKWVNFDSTSFEADEAPRPQSNVNPPAHWTEHDSPQSAARRSMVVDPPNGRVPVMKWAEDKRDYDLAHLEDAPQHETPWVRCITRGVPGGMFPAGYNNAYEIIQIPGHVVIVYEMIHETRIIPIDGRE